MNRAMVGDRLFAMSREPVHSTEVVSDEPLVSLDAVESKNLVRRVRFPDGSAHGPVHLREMTQVSHALAILLLLASAACYFGGTEEFRYNTYDEAKQAGALLGGGYLPTLMPKSAISISEKHNASTYQILMTFRFNEAERDEMIKGCHQVAVANVKSPGLKASWWPNDLKGGNFATSRYVYYYCSIDEGVLALATGEAYFWRL